MFYNSRVLAGLMAVIIAFATTILLSWFTRVTFTVYVMVFLASFLLVFLLLYFVIEVIFFRKIKNLEITMQEVTGEKLPEKSDHRENPLEGIVKDMESFAAGKQRQIDQLTKQEALRRDFIADVSHELKTPIFAAQGFVHTLLDGAAKDKAVRKRFLKKAAKSLDALDMLVQDLLTLSNIETGHIKMRFEEIDLYALTTEVFDQFREKSDKKGITMRIEGPVRKVLVYADWQRISQVMTNLISNGIKHSGKDGEVSVSFSIRKKSVITRVRDHGEGIPADHLDRIFERFYRVDKSRSREKGGTGLGLAIVKHILEGHNSSPKVESTPGRGSTFSFKLPRTKYEKTEDGQSPESASD